jgi:hypothetical protein
MSLGKSDSAILSLLAGLMLAADKIIYATSVEHRWRQRTPQLC